MSAKAVLVLCALALFAKSAMSCCVGSPSIAPVGLAAPYGLAAPVLAYDGLPGPFPYDGRLGWAGRGLAYDGLYPGYGPGLDITPTSGGEFLVTSASPYAPIGISVVSENFYEGVLAAAGELPFIGTVGFEGVLPTAGAGAVNHACGNGINAMASEPTAFAPSGYSGRWW